MSTTFLYDQILGGTSPIVVWSNIVAVVFITRIAEDVAVNVTCSKAKTSY